MKRLNRLWRDQRGQSLVFYAGAIISIVVLVGMVLEIGWWGYHYYRAQQAADLSALSAAQFVSLSAEEESDKYGSNITSIRKTVLIGEEVFRGNYGPTDTVEVDIDKRGTAITGWNRVIVTHEDIHSWLMLDEIIDTMKPRFYVGVAAIAKAEALYKPAAVVPIGLIKKTTYILPYDQSNTVVTGKVSNPSLGTANLSLGILDVTKNKTMSESNAIDWITSDYTGQQGMKVANDTAPWNKTIEAQKVATALNQRVKNGKPLILIPVVSTTTNSNGEVTILGYACFRLDSAQGTSTGDLSITGNFLKYIDTKSDRKDSSISSNAKYFGVRVIYLDN